MKDGLGRASGRAPRVLEAIYAPACAKDFEWVNLDSDEDYEVLRELDGSPRAGRWTPMAARRVRADGQKGFSPSDFPWLAGHALVMRRSAVDALRDLLEANGELLPLSTEDGVELFVLNAQVIDALDEANSVLWRFPGTNRIMDIKKPAFLGSKLEGVDLFRVPHRAMPTYVSERFVERVQAAGLRGLVFEKVWSG